MELSIIIPVYNVEQYLRQCLDSILIDNNFGGEIICINDGSTDNSGAILAEYAQQYPNIKIITQTNQGQSAARNAGIAVATGKYLYFVDSDDYLLPGALHQIRTLTETYPDAWIIYTDCAIESNGNRLCTLPLEQPVEYATAIEAYDRLYSDFNHTPHASIYIYIYMKELFTKYSLKMKVGRYYEDELQTFDIFCCAENTVCLHLDNPWYYYRTGRDGATTSVKRIKNIEDSLDIARSLYQHMIANKLDTLARKSKVFNLFEQSIIEAYLSPHRKTFRKLFQHKDLKIMRRCAQNKRELKLLRLTAISPTLMAAYRTDNLPPLQRRLINRFF